MGYNDRVPIGTLRGKILTSIEEQDDELIFRTNDGEAYRMFHDQDCCEHVSIDDISGDLNDLLNTPIIMADEETNSDSHPEGWTSEYMPDSFTWTFYKFATIKGYVTIRWFGSSNGYYSESVEFEKIK